MIKLLFKLIRIALASNPIERVSLHASVDSNDNGLADVSIEFHRKDGAPLTFGPLDIPGTDLDALVDQAEEALS